MTFIVNWNGDVVKSPPTTSLWSNKGGIFTPAKKYSTYFPLPSAYRTAIPTVGVYVVPTQFADRPDLIANHLYFAAEYWWLVLWFNGIIDPFAPIPSGTQLLVADIKTVHSLLS